MSETAPVLDACCGSRMFYFDRQDARVLYGDIRSERHELTDKSSAGGVRHLVIEPDVLIDFTSLPFESETFAMVVFDPPHLVSNGKSGWLAKKYGKLGADWSEDIRAGFRECFRVLKPHGTLMTVSKRLSSLATLFFIFGCASVFPAPVIASALFVCGTICGCTADIITAIRENSHHG